MKLLPFLPPAPLLLLALPRLIGLGAASIWYDEAFSVFAARLDYVQAADVMIVLVEK